VFIQPWVSGETMGETRIKSNVQQILEVIVKVFYQATVINDEFAFINTR